MNCLHPIRVKHPALRGAKSLSRLKELSKVDEYSYFKECANISEFLVVPCGSCYNCRKARASSWRSRLLLEQLYGKHKNALFITLTLDNEHLSSFRDDPAAFWRRFRDRFRKEYRRTPVWWFTTELGERNGRLHLHGIIWDAPFYISSSVWRSREKMAQKLSSSWKYGSVWVDYASDKTMGYITKYITKTSVKENGKIHHLTVNWNFRPKVFCSPGIGRRWGELNKSSIVSHVLTKSTNVSDLFFSCHINGHSYPLPRYFREAFTTPEARRGASYARKRNFALEFGDNAPPFCRYLGSKRFSSFDAYRSELAALSSVLHRDGLDSDSFVIDVDLAQYEFDLYHSFRQSLLLIQSVYGTTA